MHKGIIREESSNSSLIKGLLEEGVKFHGHLGPFLVLGLKAGLFANEVLGKDCFKVYVTVETKPHPPFSCILDGVQIATGCTMGKRNIELKDGKNLSVTFRKEEKILKISLKDEVLNDLKNIGSKEESESKAKILINRSFHELFNIEEQRGLSQ